MAMQWFFNLAEATRQSFGDFQIVLSSSKPLQEPLLFLIRLGDLARSNGFLGVEAHYQTLEHYSRILQTGQQWARGLVLSTLVTDIFMGYFLLKSRGQVLPLLVQSADWEWQHQRSAKRIYHTAAALGGALIKACQFASSRPDLFPATYVHLLATLQDRVPPHSWSEIENVIRQELGRSPKQICTWIEHEPIASASLAQVHRARLLDGQEVAIKVQYPDIQSILKVDLMVLQSIVAEIKQLAPGVRLQPLLDYLQETLPLELDFVREAKVMTDLRKALAQRNDVCIPAVKPELSSGRMIVMERLEGIKITDRAALLKAGISPGAVARLLNEVYAEQMFWHGILHADPHPGNLFVQAGPKLVLLDHGLTVHLKPKLVEELGEMIEALTAFDFQRLTQALSRAGMQLDEQVDITLLLQLVGVLLGGAQENLTLDTLEVGQQLSRSIGSIPRDLILVGRALGLLDGISRQLDPECNALEIVARYVSTKNG